ncbi:MAG: bifunctional 4-hydroxy-2-oxoglutarate aldolase/2-dehydro-3-deoxy-phosphogluconate aldolase [Planctomycetota bacterium]|jgi:2-dehydro-3-deoxyphosphogluconate aldolase/(4S)-4-hydroxy-2-oxoglutarate aldolase
MDAAAVHEKIGEVKVVPVVAIESVESAVPFADALIAGGLPVAEITFRTAAAADVMLKLRKERPDVMVGAGTILTVENLRKAVDSGAVFGVAPGLNPKVVEEALKLGFPFAPGVMTPNDVERGLDYGLKALKLFPAGAAGGPKFLKSLAAPYLHTGVRFIPTGGVNQDNLADYLSMSAVLAVGGTWIAKKDAIAAGEWDKIKANARGASEFVAGLGKA